MQQVSFIDHNVNVKQCDETPRPSTCLSVGALHDEGCLDTIRRARCSGRDG